MLHAVPPVLQAKLFGQVEVPAVGHEPDPLQSTAAVSVLPLQEAAPHEVLEDAWVQAPLPLHVPVLPHVVVTAHCPDGAVVPAEMAAQVPLDPPVSAALQAMQVPVQATLQQNPFAQKPVAQVVPVEHVAPMGEASGPLSTGGVDESPVDESPVDESPVDESLVDESRCVDESVVPESVDESPPVAESPVVPVSPPVPVSPGVVLSPVGLSPSASDTVTSARPPSWGIRLRSKSTSSSQPAASMAPYVTPTVTRPHLIVRFVFITVFLAKKSRRTRSG
jgi:hypothetical protein